MARYLYIFMFLLVLAAASCRKKPVTEVVTTSSAPVMVHITNKLATDINLHIYKTEEQYRDSKDPFLSTRIAAGEIYEWKLENYNNEEYYIDWYSDGYHYTNWGFSDFLKLEMLRTSQDAAFSFRLYRFLFSRQFFFNDSLIISPDMYFDVNTRNYLIQGNEPHSSWKAVNAYITYPQSNWQQLPDSQKNFTLTLDKNMVFHTHFFNENMQTMQDAEGYTNMYSSPSDSGRFQMNFTSVQGDQLFSPFMVYNSPYDMGSSVSNAIFIKDTLMLHTDNRYYLMVRQQ